MIEFEPLFDPSKRVPFKEPELDAIPKFGSILYTIWNTSGQFIYVGIGGIRGQRAQDRNPRSRILQHWQGMRSGDQFCIYVQDHFVLPALVGSPYVPQNGQIDRLVRQYIHQHLAYAYVIDQSDEGNKRVRDYERQIQQGAWRGLKPLLNPGRVRGREGIDSDGFRTIARVLKRRTDAWTKISSWYRLSDRPMHAYDDMEPIVKTLLRDFPEQCVWGTNWPHPSIYKHMPNDVDLVDGLNEWIDSESVRNMLFALNAQRLYGFQKTCF